MVISILVKHLSEVVSGFVFVMLVVAVVIGGQLVQRLVVVIPQARVLVQEGRDDGLAGKVGEALFDGSIHLGRFRGSTGRHGKYAGRIAELVVFAFGQQAFRVAERNVVHQREGQHVDVFDAAAAGVFAHQRVDHALVVLAIGRIAQNAFDLAFHLARLVREFRVYFSHVVLSNVMRS